MQSSKEEKILNTEENNQEIDESNLIIFYFSFINILEFEFPFVYKSYEEKSVTEFQETK